MQDMKEEKDDAEKNVDSLRTTLRQQEQNSGTIVDPRRVLLANSAIDKYKEENWNLEVSLQELRTQLADSQATTSRLTAESNKINKALAGSLAAVDTHKNESERLQMAYDELKAKHETDTAQSRKTAAGLQREKGDLQQALDRAKQEVVRAGRKLPRGFGSPLTPSGGPADSHLTPAPVRDDDDVFSNLGVQSTNRHRRHDTGEIYGIVDDNDSSPDASPSKTTGPSSSEIEVLQQRLAHAQRQINTLKSTLQREKETRMEYRRKLEGSPGFVPAAGDDGDDDEDDEVEAADITKRKVTPYRAATRGRGRGSRGKGSRISALTQRLGLTAAEPDSGDEYSEELTAHAIPPVPPIPAAFATSLGDELRVYDEDEEDERELDTSNRASVASIEGMDPAFANILRKPAESPLRQEVMSRSVRGGMRRSRGGAAYNEPRPTSLVGQPEPLAAELGLVLEHTPVETSEFACQTEPEPEPPAAVVITPPEVIRPTTAEFSVQVDPEPVPVPEPVVAPLPIPTIDTSTQTEIEFSPVLADMAVQSDAVPVPVIPQHTEMATQSDAPVLVTPVPIATPQLQRSNPSMQTLKRTTLTPVDISKASTVNADNTITPGRSRTFLADHAEVAEQTEAETETESETDTDHYTDAPQSARGGNFTDMQDSREDFHSVLNQSDNGFSASEDDADSIKASRLPYRRSGRVSTSAIKVAEPPKPELKEISIQTDEWLPTPAAPQVVPPSPGFALIRPGSVSQQQFQFISPPPTAALGSDMFPPESPVHISLRDSTLGSVRARTFSADRRQSLMTSPNLDATRSRPMSTQVDRSKPPVMTVPPPPRQPPPQNSMPPPSFIPDRQGRDMPPNRPSSPPPADLIQRATTPLSSRPRRNSDVRQPGASMPPLLSNMRQPASNGSFRSAANMAGTYMSVSPVVAKNRSRTSVVYDRSPRSSISSDHGVPFSSKPDASTAGIPPRTPGRTEVADTTVQGPAGGSTDPSIIHAITQTMIGEFLYKYTRKTIGKGHGDKRHKRFFWVHPYTKTLYWSSADPGSSNVSESLAKSGT